jgi:hypothetical protein
MRDARVERYAEQRSRRRACGNVTRTKAAGDAWRVSMLAVANSAELGGKQRVQHRISPAAWHGRVFSE